MLLSLVAALLTLIMTTAVLIIYSYVENELPITSVIAFVGLLILGIPITILLYYSKTDKISKSLFLSIGATMVSLIIAGIIWYIIPVSVNSPLFIPIGMFIAAISYLPLILTLSKLFYEKRNKLDNLVKKIVIYLNIIFLIIVTYFYISNTSNIFGNFKPLVYVIMLIFDISLISLSTANLLINIPTKLRYLFSIVFGYSVLSFIGDIITLLDSLEIYNITTSPQLFFDIALIFLTVTMVTYVFSNIKTTSIEEINKKLEDTTLLVEDLISQSPDSMCMCENTGMIIRANETFLNTFGLGKCDIIEGINIFDNSFNFNSDINSSIKKVKSGDIVYIDNVKYVTSTNNDIYLMIKIFPTRSSDNKIANYIFTAENITARKNAEDALMNAYDQLENRVRERTSELYNLNDTLQNEIVEHKKDEEKLIASLKEKEVLLKEIHHRVKNNMQIISSMLGLQSSIVDNKEFNIMLKDSQNRIKSMALIHERLYRSDNMANVDFVEYIYSLIQYLYYSYGIDQERIKIEKDVGDLTFNIDTAIPLGLIMNEIISNSFKHAFPDSRKGTINITIKMICPDNYEMIIKDDGIGLPENIDITNTKTLGINLIFALVDQIDGKISIIQNEGMGYKILFLKKNPTPIK